MIRGDPDRLEAAVRRLVESGEEEQAAELAAESRRLLDGPDARRLLMIALDVPEPKPSRGRALALYAAGLLAFREGAQAESRERNEEAHEIARAVGDREAESLALVGLSRVAFRDGDFTRVRALAGQARELTRELDAKTGVAPLHMLAAGTRLAGELDRAVELYTESLELNRRLGDDRMVDVELHNIGHVELHRGNVDAAERRFAECAAVRNLDDPYEAAMANLNQAALAFARGDRMRAAELLREMRSTLDGAGVVLDPDDAFEVAWLSERL